MEWIDLKIKTPSLEDIGKEFLVAVKKSTGYEYQVSEWWDMEDGETPLYFNITNYWCGQHMITREVTHWVELIELPNP